MERPLEATKMRKTRIVTSLIAGAALLGAAGCGAMDNSKNAADSPSAPASTSAAPSSSAPAETSAPETTKKKPTAHPAPTPGKSPGGSGDRCKASEMTLSLGRGNQTAGTSYKSLVFTNKSTHTCSLGGFPGVSYVAGANGHQVGAPAVEEGARGAGVTMAPGQSASADIGFVQVHNYDPSACKPTAVRGLRVYPPGDTASMFVATDGTGCAGKIPGAQLKVGGVK
jgi:hypothetical protein